MHSSEIDSYIATCPKEHQQAITRIRELVHELAPKVTESIQYKMPTFTVSGSTLCGVSSRASYIALYCDPQVVAKHRSGLKGLDVGKSCIRFKSLADIDFATVEVILAEILQKVKDACQN